MESAYQHLLRTEGEAEAKKYVYYINSYLIIRKHVNRHIIESLKEALPSIGSQGCVDELAYLVRQTYTIEDFLNEVKEEMFEEIILNFEKWDNRHPDYKFFELTNGNYLKQ
jgi:hypothetical protein